MAQRLAVTIHARVCSTLELKKRPLLCPFNSGKSARQRLIAAKAANADGYVSDDHRYDAFAPNVNVINSVLTDGKTYMQDMGGKPSRLALRHFDVHRRAEVSACRR